MKFNAPSDALPERPDLMAFRPSLAVQFGAPQSVNGKFYLYWVVRNIGPGAARKIGLFLPGVMTDVVGVPIEPFTEVRRGTLFEDKHAFNSLMKPPVHLVAEFEDHAGNLYRQYGNVFQSGVPSGAFYAYGVEELDRPYLVATRIVKSDRIGTGDFQSFGEFAQTVAAEVQKAVDGDYEVSDGNTVYQRGNLKVTLFMNAGVAQVAYVAKPSHGGHVPGIPGLPYDLTYDGARRAAADISDKLNNKFLWA